MGVSLACLKQTRVAPPSGSRIREPVCASLRHGLGPHILPASFHSGRHLQSWLTQLQIRFHLSRLTVLILSKPLLLALQVR
jgi:hypothetical protein